MTSVNVGCCENIIIMLGVNPISNEDVNNKRYIKLTFKDNRTSSFNTILESIKLKWAIRSDKHSNEHITFKIDLHMHKQVAIF